MADDDKNPKVKKSTTDTPLKVDVSLASPGVAPSLLPEIRNQFNFIKSYANSPKYKERLARMVNSERNLQRATQPGNPNFVNETFSDMGASKLNDPTASVVNKVVANNNYNLNKLANGQVKLEDPNRTNLDSQTVGAYDSSYNDIRIRDDLAGFPEYSGVGAHELSHGSTRGRSPYTDDFKAKYLQKVFIDPKNSLYSGYVQTPTEVKSRLDTIRYIGNKQGLYDARKQDFSDKDFEKFMNNKEIKNNLEFQQIMDQLPKDRKKTGFIWLMNNIAKIDSGEDTNYA